MIAYDNNMKQPCHNCKTIPDQLYGGKGFPGWLCEKCAKLWRKEHPENQ